MRHTRASRVLQILIAFQSGRKYRPDDLAKILSVSKRTLLRDIKELGKIGIRCDYSPRSRSYEVDSSTFLPAMNLTLNEAEGLLFLLHKIRNHLHFPFRNSSLLAALKIENSLPPAVRQHCSTILRNISVRPEPQVQMDLLDETFSALLGAMVKKAVVRLDFDIHEYLGRAWLMKPEGRLYNIKLRFSPQVARTVTQVRWHKTQTVNRNNDGSAIIEFRVDGLGEITWWILSYGDQVQVLAPGILRERVARIAMNIMNSNTSAQQPP